MRLELRRTNSASTRLRNLTVAGALCAVAAAVLVTGCGRNTDSTTSTAASEVAKAVPQRATTPSATAQLTRKQQRKRVLEATEVTFDKAARTAVGEVAGSKLIDLYLEGVDDEDRDSDESAGPTATASPGAEGPMWFAEVVEKDGTVHIVRIDAVTGKVIEARLEPGQDADDKREKVRLMAGATQTAEQAAKVATEKKRGTVTSADLDDKDGGDVIWSVDVVGSDWKKTDFDVDARSDVIIRQEADDS